ncbi:anion permease [Corynebacterium sp. p3-SID1056]|uniref:anion permease n=1 Tax=Corynebacterium sp. p3-SID1056 TaxID=2916092 RepID=UPI0021A8F9E2|nr:anion permease [Corynebacterium sp. p3-SID1056]MCT2339033.1 anion permease [Corynebacterium sp. p3-SID1056]
MTSAATAPASQEQEQGDKEASRSKGKIISFFLAFVALAAVLLIPIDGIEWQGQIALGMLAFAVIMWVTEAVSYPVSSVLIISLIALLVGLSPDPEAPGEVFGTGPALSMALSGFSSGAVALVAAALALATAMQATGLHRRIALYVLKVAGEKTSRIVAGAIIISIILAFFVPSATARAGAVVPILLGMVAAFGLAVDSKLSALLVITAVQAVSIWNVGIKTAAAQNLVAIGFIEDQMEQTVSWGQWFMWAAPWSVLMSIALYFIMRAAIKPEVDHIEGGRALVEKQLAEMGPMTGAEKRLTAIAVVLLLFWATEGFLHPINSSTITLAAIAIMLLPGIGVMDFKYAQDHINWGTLIVFAVGISLGSFLLETGAATWLSERTFGALGIASMPILATIAIVSLFNIIIHLGFASATSLASALIPVFIALAATLDVPNGGIGFVVIQQFVICFGFLLPISAPQNMLAYGTGAFSTRQFLKAGIPLTIVGYLLILLLSATYWQWIGLV